MKLDKKAQFMRHVELIPESTCWYWIGVTTPAGYGYSRLLNQTKRPAHRVSYEMFIGPIRKGLEIDHLCRERSCVNPMHLEPVTHRENIMRSPLQKASQNARKSECPQGHKYDKNASTSIDAAGRSHRRCRVCARDRQRRRAGHNG